MSETDRKIKSVIKENTAGSPAREQGGSGCCGATAAIGSGCDPITSDLYDASQAGEVPEEAMLASLGCGNPRRLRN